jgi:hypothetical protein
MPTGLKRYQQSKHFHFVTFSCYTLQPVEIESGYAFAAANINFNPAMGLSRISPW